jgi:hypothetical protein
MSGIVTSKGIWSTSKQVVGAPGIDRSVGVELGITRRQQRGYMHDDSLTTVCVAGGESGNNVVRTEVSGFRSPAA